MFSGSFGSIGTTTSMHEAGNNFPGWIIRGERLRSRSEQLLRTCIDEMRVLMNRPLAPFAILVAEIRDRLRCVRPVLLDLPRSIWPSAVLRRARPRAVHHGDHLLNFCRMPA